MAKRVLVLALVAVAAFTLAIPAQAGVVMLTGSDGDTDHGLTPYAIDTRDHLKQGSSLDLLVLGDAAATGAYSAALGGVGITTTTTLAGFDLSLFSGVYLLSNSNFGPGCCEADAPRIAGFETEILAMVLGGGSFGIQDYTGSAAFDFILGTSGGANAHVFGFLGGAGGTSNYDDQVVTLAGLAAGFSPYPPLGSWGHQGFRKSFFGPLGFVSLIDAPSYGDDASGLLSRTVTAVPEPATLVLLVVGGLALAGTSVRALKQK